MGGGAGVGAAVGVGRGAAVGAAGLGTLGLASCSTSGGGGIVWKVMHDKKMLRAAIARGVDEMNAVAAKLPGVVSDEEHPSELEAEAAKLADRMNRLVDDVNARLPEVDDVYGKAFYFNLCTNQAEHWKYSQMLGFCS